MNFLLTQCEPRYEVDREEKIGIGFFSDVYRGTWRGRTVAIKVLASTTPRELFMREVGIWKALRHPNVLELYGASAANSEGPWFFVSPYMRNGSLVSYLKGIVSRGGNGSGSRPHSGTHVASGNDHLSNDLGKRTGAMDNGVDMLKMMYEIARGMQYLHGMGVLHGDLKVSLNASMTLWTGTNIMFARVLTSLSTIKLVASFLISDKVS
jgi:abelson tyrosine-protein kinase 1